MFLEYMHIKIPKHIPFPPPREYMEMLFEKRSGEELYKIAIKEQFGDDTSNIDPYEKWLVSKAVSEYLKSCYDFQVDAEVIPGKKDYEKALIHIGNGVWKFLPVGSRYKDKVHAGNGIWVPYVFNEIDDSDEDEDEDAETDE